MADLEDLAGRVRSAADELVTVGDTFPARAAGRILDAANPPRRTGRLDASGRVEVDAVVFGGGVVDYAAPVHAADPFLDRAVDAAEAATADDFDTDVSAALAGI